MADEWPADTTHAAADEGAHDVEGARQLGGQGHERHAGVGRPALAGDQVDRRRAQVRGIVGAAPLGGQERALEVQAERRRGRRVVEGGRGRRAPGPGPTAGR